MKTNYSQYLLWPVGKIYELITNCRTQLYKCKIMPSTTLPCHVVSVGNLTLGGTGKTPYTIYLAKLYLSQNKRVGILSRGYKRQGKNPLDIVETNKDPILAAKIYGDEPYLIATNVPQAVVIVSADRYRAGQFAIGKYQTDVLILDDGYQHLRLNRNENILLIDYNSDFTQAKLFPQGRLRESFKNINRATQIIITKIPIDYREDTLTQLINFLKQYNSCAIISKTRLIIKNFYYQNKLLEVNNFKPTQKTLAFSGIANGNNFINTLKSLNINLVHQMKFSDHHWYNQNDLDQLIKEVNTYQAEVLVTTTKDYLKIPKSFPLYDKLYAIEIDLEFFE